MDAVNYLYENADFPDEPVISDGSSQPILSNTVEETSLVYKSLNHTYTTDQPETYELLAEFRQLLDSYKQKDGHTR